MVPMARTPVFKNIAKIRRCGYDSAAACIASATGQEGIKMPSMGLRMSARLGHRSAQRALGIALEENPPPPSETIRYNRRSKRALIDVPKLDPDHYGHVYVVGFADYVKIGWSGNVAKRLFEIQAHAPEPLVLYKLIPAVFGSDAERVLHQKFDHVRLRGEWFALSHGLPEWIVDGCLMQ